MLSVLECSILLLKKGQLPFGTTDKFHPLITVFASVFLAFSGWHSFYEFMYPVFMPQVRADFKIMPGFEQLTIEKLLYEQNQSSIQAAAKMAGTYNRTILARAHTHALIRQRGNSLDLSDAVDAYKAARSSTARNAVIQRQPLIAYSQELAQCYAALAKLNSTDEPTPAMSAICKKLAEAYSETPDPYTAEEHAALSSGHLQDIMRRYAPLLSTALVG